MGGRASFAGPIRGAKMASLSMRCRRDQKRHRGGEADIGLIV